MPGNKETANRLGPCTKIAEVVRIFSSGFALQDVLLVEEDYCFLEVSIPKPMYDETCRHFVSSRYKLYFLYQGDSR